MKNTIVLYHANCMDGFGAAFSHWYNSGQYVDPAKESVQYIPMAYEDYLSPAMLVLKNITSIIMLDCSVSYDVLMPLLDAGIDVMIVDHHKTAEWLTKMHHPNLVVIFSMDKSGAGLAWEAFSEGEEPPKFIELIEDRDLWQFRFRESKAFHAYASMLPKQFDIWTRFLDDAYLRDVIIQRGEVALEVRADIVQSLAKDMRVAYLHGTVKCMFGSCPPGMSSELGDYLIKQGNSLVIMWYILEDCIKYSLRSDDSVDVSEIAKAYGGGGHAKAAGFVFKDEALGMGLGLVTMEPKTDKE